MLFRSGIKLVNTIREEHPELFDEELTERIRHECEEAYKAEAKIIDWAVNGYKAEGLNAGLLKEFIKNRLNDSLIQIGIKPVLEVDKEAIEKTVWFDEDVLGNNATDFFFKRPVEYAKKAQSFQTSDLF